MKFKIVEAPEELLKSTSAIPFHYCGALSAFAKPKFMISPQLDILYQRISIKGCIFRNMSLYVRQSVTLLTSDHNPLISIHSMTKGEMEMQLNGMDKILLAENQYTVVQMNTDDHALILSPGNYELQRFDYTARIIQKEIPEWLTGLERNDSTILENGTIGDDLNNRLQELKHAVVNSPEQEDWIYRKLRKFLRMVLEDHRLLKD